jgi:pimeloyl-ACP methyl ester carboxylesterase
MTAAVRASQGIAFPRRDDEFWTTFARRVARDRADGRVEFAYDPAIALAFAAPQPSPPPSLMPFFETLAKVPVLTIRGQTSDILSPEGVNAMRHAKPDMAFVEVPDTGHAPTLEEPQAWTAIANFLSKVE